MKLKRLAAGIIAAVMTVTAVSTPLGDNIPVLKDGVSNTASANCLIKMDNPDQNLSSSTGIWLRHLYEVGDEAEEVKAVSYDIEYAKITGVRFTITVPETDGFGEEGNRVFWDGSIGGGVVLSFSGGDIERGTDLFDTYNWPSKQFWGVTDPELDIFTDPNTDDDPTNDKDISFEKIGAFTYQITANGFTNPIATGDASNVESIKVAFQEWGSTIANIKITKCEVLDADSNAILTFDENGKKIPNSLPKNTAYIEYADSDWEPSLFYGTGHTVDDNTGVTTDWTPGNAEINKSGSYEVSVSNITSTGIDEETGDDITSRLSGDGAAVLRVRVTELANTFGFDYESNKNTAEVYDAAALMSLAKNYGVNVSNVKLRQTQTDGTSKNITVNNSKIYFGDLDTNGDLIIEIYNEYGSTKNDSPIDIKTINFNDSLTISFDITLPELPEFSYQLYDSNSVMITGYNGSDTDIIIPEKIFNKTVIGISGNAFYGNTELTGVEIPDTVYKVGAKAFYNCTSLKSVNIPSGVIDIGKYAFGYYDDEDYNEIKSDNFKIGYTNNTYGHLYATKNGFSNEDCLITADDDDGISIIEYATTGKAYTVPSTIEGKKVYNIYAGAFCDNKTLTSVTLPDGIIRIDGSAFNGCSALTEINIPKSVEFIGWHAFEDCSSLKKIVIPDGIESILSGTFNGCSSLTDIEIPDSVTSIGDNAFNNCSSLTSIKLPDDITSIEYHAFSYCESLQTINLPSKITGISSSTFDNCILLSEIVIPDSVEYIDENAFNNCINLKSIKLPDKITEIKFGTFSSCSSLKSIVIPENVTQIYDYAFQNCTSLSDVTLPEGLTTVGYQAFYNCTSLKKITVPESVNKIENCAFGYYLTPYGYDDIIENFVINYVKNTWGHWYATKNGFSNESCFITNELDDGTLRIDGYVGNDKTYVIPGDFDGKNITAIGDNAFSGCTELTSVTIPDGVICIGDNAFFNCASLKAITIPKSVTSIGSESFYDCALLETITIPASVTFVGSNAFGFYSDEDTGDIKKSDSFKVNCYKDTAGEQYAKDNGFEYELVDHTHSYSDWKIESELSCTTDGIRTRTCSVCGKIETERTPALGHDIENGLCKNCNQTEFQCMQSKHPYDNDCDETWTIYRENAKWISVTFTEDTYTESGYDYIYIYNGNDEQIGSYTGDALSGTTITVKSDTFKIRLVSDSSSTAYGFALNTIEYGMDALCDHSNTEIRNAYSADCTNDGYTGDTYCKDCGELISSGEVIPATGNHKFGDWTITKAATCTTAGAQTRTCSGCAKVETQTIKALGHKYSTTWTTDKAATCGAAGSKSHHCTRCGAKKDVTAIPATGKHDFNNWKTTKAATYTATGTKTRTCKVCKKTETATIAKLTLAKVGGFKVKAKDSTSITLQWNKNNSASGYIIEAYNGKTWSQVTKVTSNNTLTYKVTKLSASKTYQYRIKAYKTEGKATQYSAYTATLSVNTNPSNMSGFKAKAKSYNSITLQWNKNTSATGYELQKWDGKKWVTLTNIAKNNTTTYTVKSLKSSTTYKYKIRAYKTIGKATQYSAYTATLSVNTNPSNMSGFKAKSKSYNSITLQWNKNASATGYELQKWDGKKWVTLTKINKNSTTTYTVKGLKASTTYKYRIRAYKTIGKATQYSAYTATLSVNTNPYNMSGFKAKSKSYNSITLQWNKNTSATGYELQKWDGKKWVTLTKINKNSTTTYTVKSLKASTTYKYRIRAYKTIGKATQYSAYTATLSVNTNPSNMSGFKAKSTAKTSVTLQWNKNTSATGYEIQKWNGKKWVSAAKVTKNSTVTSTVKSLKKNTSYKFRIRAYKTIGKATQYSSWSGTLTVKTKK